MSSEIFKYDFENGRKVAIVLLDTQGIFDNRTSMKENTVIFALSSLLSSVQMFNVMQDIQEADLQHLELFAGLGRLTAQNKVSKPFQRLIFLVRDWYHNDRFGFDGGRDYIKSHVMNTQPGQQREHHTLRENLRSCFEDIDCFLMPNPGNNVTTNPHFNGELKDIDQGFLAQVETLMSQLLDPQNMKVKQINGRPVKAFEFVEYFEKYFACLNSGNLPNVQSIYEATSDITNRSVYRKCQQHYAQRMTRSNVAFIVLHKSDCDLKAKNDLVKNEIMSLYDSEALLGTTSVQKLKERLSEFADFSLEGFLSLHKLMNCLKSLSVAIAIASNPELVVIIPMIAALFVAGYHFIIIAMFMSFYEKKYSSSTLSSANEHTENFWQNHFVPMIGTLYEIGHKIGFEDAAKIIAAMFGP